MMKIEETLSRIRDALGAAAEALSSFGPGAIRTQEKSGGRGLVTEADRVSDRVLHERLVRDGEGWLSEETLDDPARLGKDRVWVVDPLDGTAEFVAGIPEWCISVALIENGRPIAGGICNPATGEYFLGAKGTGLTFNGQPSFTTSKTTLDGALVLASRSELKRGEWERFRTCPFEIRPKGSVAYKLALVAAGRADATWTLVPKNEWDVAAGVALVEAAGGIVRTAKGAALAFNKKFPDIPGIYACGENLESDLASFLRKHT